MYNNTTLMYILIHVKRSEKNIRHAGTLYHDYIIIVIIVMKKKVFRDENRAILPCALLWILHYYIIYISFVCRP